MPRYVIEREIPGAGDWTDEQIREGSLRSLDALRSLGAEIQWIHSYVTDNKLYCIFVAPDEDIIRRHAELSNVPADRISRVRHLLDPTNYASA